MRIRRERTFIFSYFCPTDLNLINVLTATLVRCTRRGLTKKIYAYVYIFRKAPSRTWRVREGALRKIYAYVYIFRKAPSRTWRVREGALRKIYAYVYIFRKAPSRTWRVREGALRARMCALVTFKFSRVTN